MVTLLHYGHNLKFMAQEHPTSPMMKLLTKIVNLTMKLARLELLLNTIGMFIHMLPRYTAAEGYGREYEPLTRVDGSGQDREYFLPGPTYAVPKYDPDTISKSYVRGYNHLTRDGVSGQDREATWGVVARPWTLTPLPQQAQPAYDSQMRQVYGLQRSPYINIHPMPRMKRHLNSQTEQQDPKRRLGGQ
ncbi:hypothetical protein EJ02DRAFT_425434 [Clathrospora elynae]|uniref:Uncharacterized protein n=1 Tax=Clathrospora elynae TaxID=706981 RepID=A0A6A5SGI2_9PLEO|nr:hypothetical protein EJ02DRAFT_425434 [Clathrospora elynae]